MPKDYNDALNEIDDPIVRNKTKRAIEEAKGNVAFDMAMDSIADGLNLRKLAPGLQAEMASIRNLIERTQNITVRMPPPAAPKKTVKRPKPAQIQALTIAVEIIRRWHQTDPEKSIAELCPGDENSVIRKVALSRYKSATAPGSTTAPGFASELVSNLWLSQYLDDAETTTLSRLIANGARPLPFSNYNSVTVPSRDRDNLNAAFVGENNTIPVKSGSFKSKVFNFYKLGVITAFSNELKRVSKVDLVETIRSGIVDDTSAALDRFFLDDLPSIAGVRPAGILFGASSQPATGTGTVEDVLGDLRYLLGQLIAIRARKPVLLINPLLVASLALKTTTGTGISPFAEQLANGQLGNLPIITADTVDPTTVIALDADSLYLGLDEPEIDLSDSATLVMIDDDGVAPTMAETGAIDEAGSVHVSDAAGTVPSSKVTSMLQINSIALRFVQPTTWGFARTGTVSYLTGVNW